jgi:hypothetical protein
MRKFFLLLLILLSFSIFGPSISYAIYTTCYCSAGWPESNGCISQVWDPNKEEWVCGGSDLNSACCAECEATYGYSQCDGDGGCFLSGTLVKSRNGFSKIEDIKVGDEVTSFEDGKITQSKVSRIYERQRDFYYSLIAGDYKVKASAEHPFYAGGGKYKEISKLKKGDTVYVLQNNLLAAKKVTSNTRVERSTPVYNMTVDNTHTYFANDFAVHNKSTCPVALAKLRDYWPTITRTSDTTATIQWLMVPADFYPNGTLSIIMALESAMSGDRCRIIFYPTNLVQYMTTRRGIQAINN